jgi:hypothetical protein
MAEARLGVGFRFSVTHDGHVNIDYDREMLGLVYSAGKRAWIKRTWRFLNTLRNGLFPVGPEVIAGNVVLLTGLHLAGVDITFGLTKAIVNGLNM